MSKARQTIGEIFEHITRTPQHREFDAQVRIHPYPMTWCFRCRKCAKEWSITHGEIMAEPELAPFYKMQDGPQQLLKAMLKIPGITTERPTAWMRLQDDFLDDDT
jgi:hypothetical protein